MLPALLLGLIASLPTAAAAVPPAVVTPQLFATRVAAPTAAAQPVRLIAQDKVQLAATYYAPKKLGIKNPAVLLVHDAGSSSEQLSKMAVAWQKRGFAVLAIDLRGHGASSDDLCNWEKASEKQREMLWAMAKRDLTAGAIYLKGRREVHASRIIAAGKGAAAGLVLAHGLEDADLAGVVLIDPPHAKKDARGFNISTQLRDLEGLPTLIICGKDSRKKCDALASKAHEANDGYEYITVTPLRCTSQEVLKDSRLSGSLTTWSKKLFTSSGS